MSTKYAVSIRSDFLDVNVQAYLFHLAWRATRGMPIAAKRWDRHTRLMVVYSALCSMARNAAKK